jgi:hypothetical protein
MVFVDFISAIGGFSAGQVDSGTGSRHTDERTKEHTESLFIRFDSLCLQAGEQFLEQLFQIFDKDGDGSIDFKVCKETSDTNAPEMGGRIRAK